MTKVDSSDHQRVYAAELAAFDGTDLEEPIAFKRAAALADAVTGFGWWPGPAVTVVPARADAQSSSARCAAVGDGRVASHVRLHLASTQLTVATVAHELAHALAGIDHGHDATFRRAYVDVIHVATNIDPTNRRHALHVHQLADAFAAASLTLGPRRWPPPPDDLRGLAFPMPSGTAPTI